MEGTDRTTRSNHDSPADDETVGVENSGETSGSRRRPWGPALIGAAVVAIIVVGYALLGGDDPESTDTASPSPTATPTPSPTPSPTPTPTPSPDADQRLADASPVSEAEWQRVGPGWSLQVEAEILDPFHDPDSPMPEPEPAVIYLESPEGEFFSVLELDPSQSNAATIVAWHEDTREVRVVWRLSAEAADDGDSNAALVNLDTGESEPIEFTAEGREVSAPIFLSANAQGEELWEAAHSYRPAYFRWTPDDGWSQVLEDEGSTASESDQLGHFAGVGGLRDHTVSEDGNRVLLRRAEFDGGTYFDPHTLHVYNLAEDSLATVALQYPDGARGCLPAGWEDQSTPVLGCSMEDALDDGPGHFAVSMQDGSFSEVSEPDWPESDDLPAGVTSRVGFQEPTPPGAGSSDCGC